ncbi:MAG: PilZ domain-containing protein [Vulcanimicrobiota bacterium]
MTNALNRRSSPRLDRVVPVHYRSNTNSLAYTRSFALDLSADGARIVTHEDEDPGICFKMTLTLGDGQTLTVEGERVWERPIDNGRCKLVGVAFLSTGLGGHTALSRWITANS